MAAVTQQGTPIDMTSRERLLAVLQGESPDRIPWSPLIEGYYIAGLPQKTTDMEAAVEIGADVMLRKIPVWARSVFLPHELPGKSGDDTPLIPPSAGISATTELLGDTIFRTYRTPIGALTERWRITESSPYIPFPLEYLIKQPEDIRVYMYLVEHEEFAPHYDTYNRLDSELGDHGIITTVGPHTPVQHLLLIHMGIETFYYMLASHRDDVNDMMDLMHERNKEVYEIIGESPVEVAIEYENTGTSYVSPQVYEELEMPPMDEYADMVHAAGKVFLVHMCGRLRQLAKLIASGRQDGCIDIAPPPTGDWTLADAKQAWPGKVISGGLDTITLSEGPLERVVEHVKDVLDSIAPGERIILGTGDAVLLGTPPENLQAVTSMVEECGAYPLPA